MTFKTNVWAVFVTLVLVSVLSGFSLAQNRVPQFKDYSVDEVYNGRIAPPVITSDTKLFRTRLRWAAKTQKPNFAGHFILTTWGCGAQCMMGASIDAKTGKIYWWGFTVCCWGFNTDQKFNPIEFRLNSRLIVFSGLRNEKENDNGAHFYIFKNGRFVHFRTVSQP